MAYIIISNKGDLGAIDLQEHDITKDTPWEEIEDILYEKDEDLYDKIEKEDVIDIIRNYDREKYPTATDIDSVEDYREFIHWGE